MPRYVYWEMSGTFMVPDDTILDGSAIVLPSGDRLKLGVDNCFGAFNRTMEIYDED